MVRGTAVVTRQAEGVRQRIVTSSGTIGLSPASVREDYKCVETDIDEMLHIYLSPSPFAALAKHTSESFDAASVRYDAEFGILSSSRSRPRSSANCGSKRPVEACWSGRWLTCSRSGCSTTTPASALVPSVHSGHQEGCDGVGFSGYRIHRCESPEGDHGRRTRFGGFTQPFPLLANVQSDDRAVAEPLFIGQRRLELAKSRLVQGASIAQVTFDCGFSSESNFVRSFRRATGLTPGQHRDRIRN